MTENQTRFGKAAYPYIKLNAKQKEIFNFQKIAAILADYGYNCIKLADDWQGADFLAYHVNGEITLKVQLKSRLTINKKYCDKDIWIAFPYKQQHWYFIEHDLLVAKVGDKTGWLSTPSWKDRGGYSSISINAALLKSLAENRLNPVYGSFPLDGEENNAASAEPWQLPEL